MALMAFIALMVLMLYLAFIANMAFLAFMAFAVFIVNPRETHGDGATVREKYAWRRNTRKLRIHPRYTHGN